MRRIFRFIGLSLVLLVVILLLTASILYVLSERQLGRTYQVAAEKSLTIPDDSASKARGRHLALAVATCTLCHGEDLGGAIYTDAGPLGIITGPNLTKGRGGIDAAITDAYLERAIRHGVGRGGTSLIVMPSEVYIHLSDEDLAAIIAHIRRLPSVDRELPPTHFGPLGRALLAAGRLPLLVAEKTPRIEHVMTVKLESTADYGRYLADISGCHGCHGYGLSGGRVAGPSDLPPASNLTPTGIGSWTEADFVLAMRGGIRPNGQPINEFMPWRVFGRMTDEELHALWLYLLQTPPRAFGNK